MPLTVTEQCRVLVDNDFAGDPDGLVALAHHLLSPANRVVGITSSFLNPMLVVPPATPGGTADDGARLAGELLALVGPAGPRPPVAAGSNSAYVPGQPSAAAEAIVAEARRESELPLVLAVGGPLTNLAAALDLDPGIASRLTLAWIGGALDPAAAFEYNRDTDPAAAARVLGDPGLEVTQFPLEAYRRCAYSLAELEADLPGAGRLGAWLWPAFQSPPDWAEIGGVWPLGDSPTVLVTALTMESSTFREVRRPGGGLTRLCTHPDFRLLVGDLLARLRLHDAGS